MGVKYLGTDDSVQTCDCCGKTGLKHTVGLDFDGEIRFYGIVCAGRALGCKTKNAKDVSAAVESVNKKHEIYRKVDELRKTGKNVVYGRFYLSSRTIKSVLEIREPSGLMISQIYPKQ